MSHINVLSGDKVMTNTPFHNLEHMWHTAAFKRRKHFFLILFVYGETSIISEMDEAYKNTFNINIKNLHSLFL